MKYKWFLFDADGTLFDYDRAQSSSLEITFSRLGLSFELRYAQIFDQINKQIWLEYESGNITQDRLRIERFERLFEHVNVQSNPERFSENYLENLAHNSDLIESAEQVIRQLADKVDLLIITNGPKDTQISRLTNSAISDYFKGIVISEEVGAAKPDKRIFDAAFKRMSNPEKSEVLMIGDSLSSDIKGGNDYGIDTCWFNPTQMPCDQELESQYEIKHLNDLFNILGDAKA